MADARAGIDIIVAEPGADEFLDEEGFLISAAARGDPAKRMPAVFCFDPAQFGRGMGERLFPADFAPRLVDRCPDHRFGNAFLMRRITPGKAPLNATVPAIGLAVLVGHHTHDLFAAHFGAESAADTAIGTGRNDRALGRADLHQCLFGQRCRRAGLHARAARHAFGRKKVVDRKPGRYFRPEPAAFDGESKRPLHFVAGAHAARTDNALGRIKVEIGVGRVLRLPQMVIALAISYIAQADSARLILQLAIAVRSARQAVERVIGNIEFHHALAQLGKVRRLRADDHVVGNGRGARCGRAAHPGDFDETQAA